MIDDNKNIQDEETVDEAEEVIESTQEESETERLQAEVGQYKEQYLRVLADYQNLERRVQEQRRELLVSAGRDILLRILPILDTLQLAEKHSKDQAITASIKQFLAILSAENVKRIETERKEFDPLTMECVTTAAGKENIILEELRAGYLLGEKVLRTAQVVVGDGSAKQNSDEKN